VAYHKQVWTNFLRDEYFDQIRGELPHSLNRSASAGPLRFMPQAARSLQSVSPSRRRHRAGRRPLPRGFTRPMRSARCASIASPVRIISKAQSTGTSRGGREIRSPAPGMAMVFQDYGHALLMRRTVRRNVALGVEGRLRDANGGESVSQLPLKDKAFLTFLDQNPPFALRPKKVFRPRQKPVAPLARSRRQRHQATSNYVRKIILVRCPSLQMAWMVP
jgi:hypothetical protein